MSGGSAILRTMVGPLKTVRSAAERITDGTEKLQETISRASDTVVLATLAIGVIAAVAVAALVIAVSARKAVQAR